MDDEVSVSSCGSSWFLGPFVWMYGLPEIVFQYPLADRVGFWGSGCHENANAVTSFSILLRIELVFGA